LFSSVFALTTGGPAPVDLVRMGVGAVIVLLVLGVVAVLGGLTHRHVLVAAAGAGLVVAALLQLAQLGRDANMLGGNGSTVSLLGGLGLGLLVVALPNRSTRSE
jgi:hypothetical protein